MKFCMYSVLIYQNGQPLLLPEPARNTPARSTRTSPLQSPTSPEPLSASGSDAAGETEAVVSSGPSRGSTDPTVSRSMRLCCVRV